METNREVLLGKLAVQRGVIKQTDLDRCLQEQAREGGKTPLGVMLVKLGLINPKHLAQLMDLQRQNLQAPSPYTKEKVYEEDLFGKHAVEKGLITQAQLNECIRLQSQATRSGRPERLGEVLVRRGYATVDQVKQLLARQQKKVLRCPRCGAKYNVHPMTAASALPCKKCKAILVDAPPVPSAAGLDDMSAEGSWYFDTPAPAPVPSVRAPGRKATRAARYSAHGRRYRRMRMNAQGAGIVAVVLLLGGIGVLLAFRNSPSSEGATKPTRAASADSASRPAPSTEPAPSASAEASPPGPAPAVPGPLAGTPPTTANPSSNDGRHAGSPKTEGPPATASGAGSPPSKADPTQPPPAPARDWDPALEKAARPAFDRASEAVRDGDFAKAAEAIRQAAATASAGKWKEYLESRAASLAELADFHARLLAAINGGKNLSVKGLAEFKGLDGDVKEADAKSAIVSTLSGAKVGKPWSELSVATMRKLSEAALGPSGPLAADLWSWGMAHASTEDLEALWAEASKGAAMVGAFAAYHDHELSARRSDEFTRALADAERLSEDGAFAAVMDAFDGLKKRFAGVPGIDLAGVERKQAAYVERKVREVTELARSLIDVGKPDRARELIAPLRERLAGTSYAAELDKVWELASAKKAPPGPTPADPGATSAPKPDPKKDPMEPKPPKEPPVDKGPPPGFGSGKKWPRPGPGHYVNVEYGVAIVPPHGWTPIPAAKEATGEWRFNESLRTVASFEAKNPDGDDYELKMDLKIFLKVSSIDEAVKAYLKERDLDPAEVKVQPTRVGPWEARTYEVTTDYQHHVLQARDKGVCFYHQVTVIYEAPRAAVVSIVCGDRYGRKHSADFHATAGTFLFLSADDNSRVKEHGGGSAELPAGWHSLSTDHYDIQYECDDAFAQEITKHLEAILKEYSKRWAMKQTLEEMSKKSSGKAARRFTVKVFKNYDNFSNYAGQNGVGGAMAYFSPMQDELVCYKTTDEGKKKTFHVLYHEASHQYVHLYMGYKCDIPTWVDEGVAEVFYGGQFGDDGSFRIGVNMDRIQDIKEAIRGKTYVPVKEIMQYTQAQYYSNAGVCYAEGWSLAYFFWWTTDKTYTGRLDKFYAVLKSSKDKDQAYKEAFGDLDMDKLQADWKDFVLKLGS